MPLPFGRHEPALLGDDRFRLVSDDLASTMLSLGELGVAAK